jgi:hypothetical protein
MAVDFNVLRNTEKQRYIADHAPHILSSLIVRRASTDPLNLIALSIETAGVMYDTVMVNKRGSAHAMVD